MLEHTLWGFVATNIQSLGLRNEQGPAERWSLWGEIKSMGERECCWRDWRREDKQKRKSRRAKKHSSFCGMLWLVVVRRIKARYHMPPLKGHALE